MWSAVLAVATAAWSLGGAGCAARVLRAPSPPGFELLLLHNNDMHARFEQTSQLSGVCSPQDRDVGKCYGGFPRVAHLVKEARAAAAAGSGPSVLYLNAGDTYTGTAWFTIYKWQIAAECLNALRPDAVSLGNHEFDNGISGLTPFIENLTCPVLAANLQLQKVPQLAAETNLHKSFTFDVDGVKVGVIGYLTPDTKFLAVKNDVEYIDEVVAIREEVARLRAGGVQILIALGHSGFTKDLEIAREVDGIDVVIGGHTNTFLWNGTSPDAEKIQGPYPTVVTQKSGRKVPVVQAYAYTKYLGKLHLIFDTEGEIVSYDGNPILLDATVPQDAEVLEIIDRYRDRVVRESETVMGNSSVFLDGESCRLHECNLGNLIADAMVYRYAVEYEGERWTDAPVAFVQGGGIRASIDPPSRPGPVTRGDLLTVMPFESRIVAVTMNGEILLAALEHSVAEYSLARPPGQFLQMSGVRVTYDLAAAPHSRVVAAVVRCWACAVPQFYELEATREYKVLMPSFLAQGGDGFDMFSALPQQELAYDELSCAEHTLARRSPVYPEVAQRVVLLNEPEEEEEGGEEEGEEELEEGGQPGSAGAARGTLLAALLATVVLLRTTL